jgi:hypothetical protein
MTNANQKIIVVSGIIAASGFITLIVVKSYKRKKMLDKIYEEIEETTGGEAVSADEKHKFSKGLDPNFWKTTTGSPLPTQLIPDKTARDRARKINAAIGLYDDEDAILAEIKKSETQGQLSQLAFIFDAEGYGNLGDKLQDSLDGGTFTKDRLKELNLFIDALPY